MFPGRAIPGLLAVVLLGLNACSGPEQETPTTDADVTEADAGPTVIANTDQLVAAAGKMQQAARAVGGDMMESCRLMQRRVLGFLESPDDAGRDAARTAWHDCYEHWNSFLVFHQVAFSPRDAAAVVRTGRLINTRPFQPGYIDGLPEYPYSGLVHEVDLPLSLPTLLDQHQMMDEESAALGFPVLETLLWREPLAENWITDPEAEGAVVSRRKQYLEIATRDLLDQLQNALARWQTETQFRDLPDTIQIRVLLRSMERLAQQELLSSTFADAALEDPEWHHPAAVAGQGKRHLLARLAGLERLLLAGEGETNPIAVWIGQTFEPPTLTELRAHLKTAHEKLAALPDNAPLGEVDPSAYEQARDAMAALTMDLQTLYQTASGQ